MIVTVQAPAAAALLRGHPWVFREGVRSIRGQGKTGEVAQLVDPKGAPLGWGLYDAESAIAARAFGAGTSTKLAKLDERRLVELVGAAVERRRGIYDPSHTTALRLCHGEGDRVPGLVLDRYEHVVVAKTDGAAIATWIDRVAPGLEALLAPLGVSTLVLRIDAAEGAPKIRGLWGPSAPATIDVLEHGMRFEVDLAHGQKTGAFLDQRENRRRVRALAADKPRVLNLFSYAGGFSLAAALGGAREVTSVDSAARAHASAQRSFKKNGLSLEGHRFVTADAFVFLESAKKRGERFDLVISDPPSFAPNERSKRRALSAYARLHRACVDVLAEGGTFCAASCSSHVTMEELLGTLDDVALGRGDLSVVETFGPPPDHPTLACFPEGRYLKLAIMR
ncbi:MAG: class I SAM-dependent rRNA methyltransferase [Polyangiaceae bacterium]|nr:class I SAM-dependent rRNA methyltransferase [Polyangiaceae bacterium]